MVAKTKQEYIEAWKEQVGEFSSVVVSSNNLKLYDEWKVLRNQLHRIIKEVADETFKEEVA